MIFSDINNERMMLGKSRLTIVALRRQKKLRKNSMTIYFPSIGPSLAENIDNSECNYSQFVNRVDGIFHFQPVSSSQVYKLLNSLSVCKASGIDKISAKVLKWVAPVVSESIMQIFNRSNVSNVFPNEWKVARVNALHKKG